MQQTALKQTSHETDGRGEASREKALNAAHTVETIDGRFRPISTCQLCLAWWLYRESHITRRQLRVYFALHEMAERRQYTKTDGVGGRRKPTYLVEEVASLVTGRGSESSIADLQADLRKLARIGLAQMTDRFIGFARSPEQIKADDLSNFSEFWDEIPNRKRCVPVPRRTLRALAAGFTKSVTGTLIALMIRSIHWHKREGEFRIDGRTKGSWISDVFGLSRRAVTDARGYLIQIGWFQPLETPQILMNRYGNHDRVNVAWTHRKSRSEPIEEQDDFASPPPENSAKFASPIKNRILSSTKKNLKNKNSELVNQSDSNFGGDRGEGSEKLARKKRTSRPNINAIEPEHLRSTESLLELHEQAVGLRTIEPGERGRLDFVAFAERARSRGQNPGALFTWLLRNRKFKFIAQVDEDAAIKRLKEHVASTDDSAETRLKRAKVAEIKRYHNLIAYSEEDKIVRTCYQLASKYRLSDPYSIARKASGWSREQWDEAREDFELRFGRLRR